MSLAGLIEWSEASWLGEVGRDVFWVFPTAEIVHFVGLCLLMGTMLIIDLRLLGVARHRVSIEATLGLIPAAIVGLLLNFTSGIVFLCAQPNNYWPSLAFKLKLLAVTIGAANAVWFKYAEAPRLAGVPDDFEPGTQTKVIAALSLIVWTVVIVLGRILPFVSTSTS